MTADRLYSMSMAAKVGDIAPEQGVAYLNVATRLDSTNAALYYQKYKILHLLAKNEIRHTKYDIREQQLHLLRRCINLCPSWAQYHLLYALTAERLSTRPNIFTQQLILSELEKATTLKPYSPMYKDIYQKYLSKDQTK